MTQNQSSFTAATRAHAHRVAAWSSEIARGLGLPGPDQELVRETAMAHHYPLDYLGESGLARLGRDIGLHSGTAPTESSKPAPAVYALLQAMRSFGFTSSRVQLLAGIIEVANFWDEQLEFSPFSDEPLSGVLERTIAAGRQIGFSPEVLDALTRLKLAGPSALDDALKLLPAEPPKGLFASYTRICGPLKELYFLAGLRGLWEHSMAAAKLTARLAGESGRVPVEEAFLGGLLHDIGRLPMALLDGSVVSTLERLRAAGCEPIAAELSVCGFDHAEAGSRLLTQWKVPPRVASAVRWHHEPERDYQPLTGLLYLAEQYLGGSEDLPSTVRMAASLQSAGMPDPLVV